MRRRDSGSRKCEERRTAQFTNDEALSDVSEINKMGMIHLAGTLAEGKVKEMQSQ